MATLGWVARRQILGGQTKVIIVAVAAVSVFAVVEYRVYRDYKDGPTDLGL